MIAIGALGGSGTRAIAEILIRSGIYMGDDLNGPNDNLIFTRLFKNPEWYMKSSSIQKKRRLVILENYMKSNKLTLSNLIELFSASQSNPTFHTNLGDYLRFTAKVFGKGNHTPDWGWKEPNTHIYVSEILEYFKDLKYIHVLRHGLDMAFSNNKQQLNNWGWKYNIILDGKENDDELAIKQLDYWIESTKDVIKKTKKHENRLLLVNHSIFCQKPKHEIDKIIEFTGINVSISRKKKLYEIPKNTGSNSRYKTKDLGIFSNHKLQFIQEMGFEI